MFKQYSYGTSSVPLLRYSSLSQIKVVVSMIKTADEVEMNMSFRQTRLLNGLLLGKGLIDKKRNELVVRNISEEYADWLVGELDEVGAIKISSGDSYKVVVSGGEWLSGWRDRWYKNNMVCIPERFLLTEDMAGVWYHDKGSVDGAGRVRFNMNGMRHVVDDAVRLLEDSGFISFSMRGDIYIVADDSTEFLSWIKKPEY